MPIYEYRCDDCSAEFEELTRRGTPDEEVECPECAEHSSHRVMSAFAVSGGSSGGGGYVSSGGGCGSSGFS
jgi:putative FmdB family regulatory protein